MTSYSTTRQKYAGVAQRGPTRLAQGCFSRWMRQRLPREGRVVGCAATDKDLLAAPCQERTPLPCAGSAHLFGLHRKVWRLTVWLCLFSNLLACRKSSTRCSRLDDSQTSLSLRHCFLPITFPLASYAPTGKEWVGKSFEKNWCWS